MPNYGPVWFTTSTADNNQIRLWIQGVEAALLGAGLVKVPQTGQIDPTSATVPSLNTQAGYSVFRLNDALQATKPVFIKVGYGRGGNNSGIWGCRLSIEIATGNDGALGMSGLGAGNVYVVAQGTTTTGTSTLHWSAGDGSGFNLVHGMTSDQNGNRTVIFVDRFRNPDGTPNGDGLLLWISTNLSRSTGIVYDRILGSMFTVASGALFPPVLTAGDSSVQADGSMPLAPIFAVVPSLGIFRSKMALVYNGYDAGLYSRLTVPHLAASRTFQACGSLHGLTDAAARAYCSVMTWWAD